MEKLQRLKNVYKITAETENGRIEKYIFSHSHDNAAKKMRIYLERNGNQMKNIVNIELLLEGVLY